MSNDIISQKQEYGRIGKYKMVYISYRNIVHNAYYHNFIMEKYYHIIFTPDGFSKGLRNKSLL